MVNSAFLNTLPTLFNNINTEISLYFCDNCKSDTPDIVEDVRCGDLICRDCGYVINERMISEEAEFRNFADSDTDNSRVGHVIDPLLRVQELSTYITTNSSSKNASTLTKQQKTIEAKSNKNLKSGFSEISRMVDRMGLPEIIQTRAKELFRKIDDLLTTNKGRSPNGYIAASVYYACRQESMARTITEIMNIISVSKKDLSRCIKNMKNYLPSEATNVQSIKADDFLSRYCNNLNLSKDIVKASSYISNKLNQMGELTSKSPLAVTASCIYFTCQLLSQKITLKMISDVVGITSVTISNNYREMLKIKEHLLPPNFQHLESKLLSLK